MSDIIEDSNENLGSVQDRKHDPKAPQRRIVFQTPPATIFSDPVDQFLQEEYEYFNQHKCVIPGHYLIKV